MGTILNKDAIEALLARCTQGDDAAKAAFYDEYHGLVQNAVRRKAVQAYAGQISIEDIADICHEVFERLFQNDCRAMGRLNEPAVIAAWLMTITRNHVVTYMRKRVVRDSTVSNVAREPEEQYPATPDQRAIQTERQKLLQDKLAELAPADRLVIELYYVQNLKYSEIADILGVNINTASARLRRAKIKLHSIFKEDLDEFSLQ